MITMYNRWKSNTPNSWPYRVLRQYDDELVRMEVFHMKTMQYVFKCLDKDGAEDESPIGNFIEGYDRGVVTVKRWVAILKNYENWLRLNQLMAMMSSFETYIASVVKLAIDSNPGLLIGCPKEIDGIKLVKEGKDVASIVPKALYDSSIKNCVDGDWDKRLSSMSKLFGDLPAILSKEETKSELQKMSDMRNKIGHAFGRDIDKARDYELIQKLEIERIGKDHFDKCHKLIKKVALELDKFLLKNIIGNYQILYQYHRIHNKLSETATIGEKAIELKRSLAIDKKDMPYSKLLCKWAVEYYSQL